jgi:hypothetical protein
MEKKDNCIIDLKAIIEEYEETLSNEIKHIMELENKLCGGGRENASC